MSNNQYSGFPVRYSSGELIYSAEDIPSAGFGVPWGYKRRFMNRMSISETTGNGFNWQIEQWCYLVIDYDGNVIVQGRPQGALWFDLIDNEFVGRFAIRHTLIHDDVANLYRLTELEGTVVEFDDATGRFKRLISPGGETVTVTALAANQYNLGQVERAYTAGGNTVTEQLNYEYDKSLGDTLLTAVTLRRQVNGGSWASVARAQYTYYDYDESHGSGCDLKSVTTSTWEDSAWVETGTSHYRYYQTLEADNSSSSSSSGESEVPAYLLKYVVNPATYARMVADELDPLSVSDGILATYADHYFEYDVQRRVTKERVQGGSQTFTFSYVNSGFSDDIRSWKTKTTETLPDGSQKIVFSNYAGQTLLSVIYDDGQEWCRFYRYNDQFQLEFTAEPSAVLGYDDQLPDLLGYDSEAGLYEYLRDDDGLITLQTYHEPSGYLASESVLQGQLGTPVKLREMDYCCCCDDCGCDDSSSSSSSSSSSGCACGVWKTQRETVYPSAENQSLTQVTSYCYAFHPDTCAVREKVTTLPVVPVEQNGTGIAATRREVYDTYGNLTWLMDERGFITRMSYDIPTGAIIQRVEDVDTSLDEDAPDGWITPAGGGLHLVTDFEHDAQGRITQVLGPVHTVDLDGTPTSLRRATWTVYADSSTGHTVRVGQGYATGSAPGYTYTLINPVSITRTDLSGKLQEQLQATRASTSGKLLPSDTFAQSSYTRWRTLQYTDCCTLASERVYHTIPASGTGSAGTHYDETGYGTDVRKRRNRTVTPGGTITRTVLDVRGLVTSTWIGTNDTGGTASDPSGGGTSGNTMVVVTENQYDDHLPGGDGHLTRQTQHVNATTTRVTTFSYDYRGRRLITDGELDFYQQDHYDNLNRVIQTERYDTNENGNLISRSEMKYDERGRVYQRIRYGVDPTTGTAGNALTDNTWYDSSGHVLCSLPAGSFQLTKMEYDSLGRTVKQFVGYNPEADLEAPLGNGGPDSVEDDVILEQSETSYDAASNVLQTTQRQRYHNAPDTQPGELQTPAASPKARVTYLATYADAVGRTIATANFGTNGGSVLSRPSTIPARSDTVLITSQTYDEAGHMTATTDPAGMVVCLEYDAVGRETAKIMNCDSSSSSSDGSSSSGDDCEPSNDTNVTVLTAYNADGNVASITAVNPTTGNQVTQYVYGTTLADSDIAASTLKREEIYPDSADSDDAIKFTYNRQWQVTTVTDQAGTIHAYDYDKLGRQTQDRVTALGSGVDDAVRRIATTYEVRGMKASITSYDNPTAGSGNVLNQCQFVYNDLGQLVTEYQAHDGTVNVSTTPKVQYTYADGSNNTIRPTGIVYPDGRMISYDYGTANDINDRASRITAILDDDDSTLAGFAILGRNTFVEQTSPEPQLKWTLIDLDEDNDPDTGDIYTGLDRFGRVKDNRWYNYDAEEDVDRIQYGYDRAGNRIWRKNPVAASYGKNFDELYGYDAIHRLKEMNRGTLTTLKDAVTDPQFAECWSLDATGNWQGYKQSDDGWGWSLAQTRMANDVNEITDITNTVGPAWVEPEYSAAGNMTTMPQPNDPTNSYTASYDAWNRLVKIADGPDTVSAYAYDGAKRRVVQLNYEDGVLNETRHLYYTEPSKWQVIEERLGSSPDAADADRQFVWGLRYIDDLIVRDRDTNANGTLDERLYACQDANWNITAIVANSGNVQKRFAYSAYGEPLFVSSSFIYTADNGQSWDMLYCGYRRNLKSGLYDVRHRAYSGSLGFWLQRDPGIIVLTHNFQYVESSPISFQDSTGMQPDSPDPFNTPSTLPGDNIDPIGGFFSAPPIGTPLFEDCTSFMGIGHPGGRTIIPISGTPNGGSSGCSELESSWESVTITSVVPRGAFCNGAIPYITDDTALQFSLSINTRTCCSHDKVCCRVGKHEVSGPTPDQSSMIVPSQNRITCYFSVTFRGQRRDAVSRGICKEAALGCSPCSP